jgi:hypothetical protein
MAVAGGSFSTIFAPGLDQTIFQHSKGIPRLINMLCDTALILAFVDNASVVSAGDIHEAVTELGWLGPASQTPPETAVEVAKAAAEQTGLAVLVDADDGTEYPITDAVCVIGRARDCSVRINHPALSRYHAMIKRVGDAWSLSDMKSMNGVYLNGRRVRAARLRHNDDLGLGEHNLVFRLVFPAGSVDDSARVLPAKAP